MKKLSNTGEDTTVCYKVIQGRSNAHIVCSFWDLLIMKMHLLPIGKAKDKNPKLGCLFYILSGGSTDNWVPSAQELVARGTTQGATDLANVIPLTPTSAMCSDIPESSKFAMI